MWSPVCAPSWEELNQSQLGAKEEYGWSLRPHPAEHWPLKHKHFRIVFLTVACSENKCERDGEQAWVRQWRRLPPPQQSWQTRCSSKTPTSSNSPASAIKGLSPHFNEVCYGNLMFPLWSPRIMFYLLTLFRPSVCTSYCSYSIKIIVLIRLIKLALLKMFKTNKLCFRPD